MNDKQNTPETTDDKLSKITALVEKMDKLKDLNLELSKQYQEDDRVVIPKSAFLGIEVGARIDLDTQGTHYAICIFANDACLKFAVVGYKYSIVNIHSHDFEERLVMLEGRIREMVSQRIFLEEDRVILKAEQPHGFVSELFSIYSLEVFLKDQE